MDRPLKEITEMMKEQISRGRKCWVKWTCPGCGERITAEEANTIPLVGAEDRCIHHHKQDGSVCGTCYIGDEFGLRVLGGEDMLIEILIQHGIGVKQFIGVEDN